LDEKKGNQVIFATREVSGGRALNPAPGVFCKKKKAPEGKTKTDQDTKIGLLGKSHNEITRRRFF